MSQDYKTSHNMVLKIRYATVRTIPADLCVAKTNKDQQGGAIENCLGFVKGRGGGGGDFS